MLKVYQNYSPEQVQIDCWTFIVYTQHDTAQLAGAVEQADCVSSEG